MVECLASMQKAQDAIPVLQTKQNPQKVKSVLSGVIMKSHQPPGEFRVSLLCVEELRGQGYGLTGAWQRCMRRLWLQWQSTESLLVLPRA